MWKSKISNESVAKTAARQLLRLLLLLILWFTRGKDKFTKVNRIFAQLGCT